MPSLYDIRAALRARLATVEGLRTYGSVPESVNPPMAYVGLLESVEFDTAFARGADRWLIPVRVLVAKATDRAAQAKLDSYLAGSGAASLKAAIEGDGANLGGNAHTVRVTGVRDYGVIEHGGVNYLGAELLVDIIA